MSRTPAKQPTPKPAPPAPGEVLADAIRCIGALSLDDRASVVRALVAYFNVGDDKSCY
jgi:hypothetical protein